MPIYKLGGIAVPMAEATDWATRVQGEPATELVTVLSVLYHFIRPRGWDLTVITHPTDEEKVEKILIITHKQYGEKTDDSVDYLRDTSDDIVEQYLAEKRCKNLEFITIFKWMKE